MATFKDMEDSLRSFIVQEQSDAHNVKSVNVAKYNNIKVWMDTTKYFQPYNLVLQPKTGQPKSFFRQFLFQKHCVLNILSP